MVNACRGDVLGDLTKFFTSAKEALGIRLGEGKGTCTGCISLSHHTVANWGTTGYAGGRESSL